LNHPRFPNTPEPVEVLFDRTGSYDIVWTIIILLGVLAMAVNLPVGQHPLPQSIADFAEERVRVRLKIFRIAAARV